MEAFLTFISLIEKYKPFEYDTNEIYFHMSDQ